MIVVYTSPGCSSCRKVKNYLKDNHLKFIEKNIFNTLLNKEEIKYLISRTENGTDDIISKRSKIIQEELRGALNFDGVIVTGPLYEGAITESYTSDKAAVEALKAGADIIYLPEDFEVAYNGILSALQNGELTEDRINESISRIYRIKYAEQAEKLSGK